MKQTGAQKTKRIFFVLRQPFVQFKGEQMQIPFLSFTLKENVEKNFFLT